MIPSSEHIEEFLDRIKELDTTLARMRGAEVTSPRLMQAASDLAKEWLRLSQQLTSAGGTLMPPLEEFDREMLAVLACTQKRSRASTYRLKLKPLLARFFEVVVVPIIRYEGSPAQVSARQLEGVFKGCLSGDEEPYLDEAARCAGMYCNRASIILLWAAAIARLHRAVQKAGFDAFNIAASAAVSKKGPPFNRAKGQVELTSLAELQRMSDFQVLVVGIEFWGYDLQTFEELERLLSIRNSAAHPGSYTPSTLEVYQFALKLKEYVFKRIGT